MNLMKLKWLWFGISGLVILPGLISLFLWGLNLGIDFTGGTLLEERISTQPTIQAVEKSVTSAGATFPTVAQTSSGTFIIRTKPLDQSQVVKIQARLSFDFTQAELVRFETVGPTIGAELLQKALIALFLASAFIVAYIAWSFRSVPKPASSIRFGIAAIAALLHDVLVVVGVFSILGHYLKVEVDSLFVTAVLTVIGFSVHDTIVVFDRIRENLRRNPDRDFTEIANISLLQTLVRSLSTSLTVVLTLLAVLLLVGPVSSRLFWFVMALLIGIISGTYSSIFNATPLLVLWQEHSKR
jgi:preprotein translocase subunit SecF